MFNPLEHFGVSSKVISDLGGKAPNLGGKVLLLDGDGCCYSAASQAAREATAIKRFQEEIFTEMYRAGCSSAVVHLTPSGCFKNGRHLLNTVKPYQANRQDSKNKPKHLELLRSQYVADKIMDTFPEITVHLHYDIEADDALIIDHYKNPDWVLVSPDKDLLMSPYVQYIVDEGRSEVLMQGDTFGWISRKDWIREGSGVKASKLIGKGTKFFLAQMLMGDTADNVQGILKLNGKACGLVGAYEALNPIVDSHEAVNFVIEAYREIQQNIIAEAEAMWLLRNRRDSSYKFFKEHELTPLNLEFLDECYNSNWKREQ